jgi:glucokinase
MADHAQQRRRPHSSATRPAGGASVAARTPRTAVGVDIGASTIKLAICDETGHIGRHDEVPTPRGTHARDVIARIVRIVSDFRRATPDEAPAFGVGFTVPQYFEGPSWIQRATNNMPGLEGVPLYEPLRDAFGKAIALTNDVNAATIAEYRFGHGRGSDRLLLMSVGTGSSIGVIIENRLLDFNWGAAGDSGQIIVDPIGLRPCTCGGHGCLDTVAAAPAIRRDALRAAEGRARTSLRALLNRRGDLSARDVALEARRGDRIARAILSRAGRFIGIALTTYLHVFRPDTIVLAGGVSQAGAPLVMAVRRAMTEMASPFYLSRLRRVAVSRFPKWAAAIGASTLILEPDRYAPSRSGDAPTVEDCDRKERRSCRT